MTTMEASLTALESTLAEAQKSADALTKALRQIKKSAASGHLGDLEKSLGTIVERAEQAQSAAATLPRAWNFDAKGYLHQGYVEELKQEAKGQGVTLIEKDGRLYSFPVVLRIVVVPLPFP